MRISIGAGALALALVLAGCGGNGNDSATGNGSTSSGFNPSGPLPKVAAPNNANWAEVVSQTPEGGVRMGNPDAPVKLVEYASITCGHCAAFSNEASEELRNDFVGSGQVSWEYRPFMLFPTDPGIFMLLRCQQPAAFFRMAEQLYRDHGQWSARLGEMTPEQQQQIQSLAPPQRAAALVRVVGLDQFFRQRGMPEARLNSCLANQSELEALTAITERAAREEGVTGTPTFFINGEQVSNVGDWGSLEPVLRGRIGG
jgi:protein-disulfide isomerase